MTQPAEQKCPKCNGRVLERIPAYYDDSTKVAGFVRYECGVEWWYENSSPFFTQQTTACKLREQAAQLQALAADKETLQKFKDYVHKRLDEAGVPHDPDPEHNKQHGCRIEGRLNWILADKARLEGEVERLRQEDETPLTAAWLERLGFKRWDEPGCIDCYVQDEHIRVWFRWLPQNDGKPICLLSENGSIVQVRIPMTQGACLQLCKLLFRAALAPTGEQP